MNIGAHAIKMIAEVNAPPIDRNSRLRWSLESLKKEYKNCII